MARLQVAGQVQGDLQDLEGAAPHRLEEHLQVALVRHEIRLAGLERVHNLVCAKQLLPAVVDPHLNLTTGNQQLVYTRKPNSLMTVELRLGILLRVNIHGTEGAPALEMDPD